MKNLLNNLLAFLISLVLFLGLFKIADFAYGVLSPRQDLIFAPNSSAVYKTDELDCTARINSLGFRGPVPEKDKGDSFHVLLIGDSFTFGWGLDWDETWCAVAEKALQAQGYDVRLFNLGKPGSNPEQYPGICEAALPLVDPDLIIVSILQGDDLFQITPLKLISKSTRSYGSNESRWFGFIRRGFRRVFPNFGRVIFSGEMLASNKESFDISQDWRKQSQEIYQFFNADEKQRFDALDDKIEKMFFDGGINPKLVYDAVMIDDRFMVHEDLEGLVTQRSIGIMANSLRSVKQLADEYPCDIELCMVPYAPYVDSLCGAAFMEMGFAWNPSMLTSNASLEAVRQATERAGINFHSPLEQFRALPPGTAYYKYDSHFNPQGASLYAESIVDIIKQHLK